MISRIFLGDPQRGVEPAHDIQTITTYVVLSIIDLYLTMGHRHLYSIACRVWTTFVWEMQANQCSTDFFFGWQTPNYPPVEQTLGPLRTSSCSSRGCDPWCNMRCTCRSCLAAKTRMGVYGVLHRQTLNGLSARMASSKTRCFGSISTTFARDQRLLDSWGQKNIG